MPTTADMFAASLNAALSANAQLAAQAPAARGLGDTALIDAQRAIADARRHLDACASVVAGEVVRRSSLEAGLTGLARKEGFRTPEALIQHTTGATSRDAATLVRAGTMINDAVALDAILDSEPDADGHDVPLVTMVEPWLARVGQAIAAGRLSIAAAESIRNGLGRPGPGVDVDSLERVACELLKSAGEVNPDELFRIAREARDVLDAEGIAGREHARRAKRSFRRWRKPDGMTRYVWELDPEGAAIVDDIYDAITSPRRGGPRFVDEAEKARAEAIANDPRTTEQLASDGMLAMLRIAVDAEADPRARSVMGRARPAVRVLVTASDLETRIGAGRIEAHADPVSIETVERYLCDSGLQAILFDQNGQAIDVGREQRLFTNRQRLALSARDGGCMWPGCDRPPAWTEAHHIQQWKRDNGKTELCNGILLCRHHHVLLHDSHWEIELRASEYWLIPPEGTSQVPRPMRSKSAALQDLQRERQREQQRGRRHDPQPEPHRETG
ncbi:MAG TPA: DUF222 domain-containing protein [Terrimesophilobacter sp.]|uniref:HNH endonuclease signature motif containing protein n=1 Tax=Terrimesophilobacter sp. TaxID=2906435 RepID=UPI002F944CEF